MEKKYKLTEESIKLRDRKLYRIEAIRDFGRVSKGQKGGFVETESNLSQVGDAWVYDDAKVFGNAKVYGDAKVFGNAEVCGDAKVYGNAKVYDDAKVCGDADYIVFKNWWSSGRYFTWTRSNNKWMVGCFYGTGEELIKKAYDDSEKKGREYERVVKYVESMLTGEKEDQ